MASARTFISFDYDHDEGQKHLLVGQAKNTDSPFNISDWSIKEPITGNWREKARGRIAAVDVVIVMCGFHTNTASGVTAEMSIAQEIDIPYFLLAAYKETCIKPLGVRAGDKIYNWTWPNLKLLIHGNR